MTTMTQLNVRIEPQLKSAGDATLSRASITPTQLIRALWLKIAQGAEALDQVLEVLAKSPAASSAAERGSSTQADPFEEKFQAFYVNGRLDYSAYTPPTEEEWEQILYEEWHHDE